MPIPEQEILAVVREFVDDQGGDPAKIVPEANLRDLGIDSLLAVELAFRFEDRFGITIPFEDFPMTTVAEAVRFVSALNPKVAANAAD